MTTEVFLKRSDMALEFYSDREGTKKIPVVLQVSADNTKIVFNKVEGEKWSFTGITFVSSSNIILPEAGNAAAYTPYGPDYSFTDKYPPKPSKGADWGC